MEIRSTVHMRVLVFQLQRVAHKKWKRDRERKRRKGNQNDRCYPYIFAAGYRKPDKARVCRDVG